MEEYLKIRILELGVRYVPREDRPAGANTGNEGRIATDPALAEHAARAIRRKLTGNRKKKHS